VSLDPWWVPPSTLAPRRRPGRILAVLAAVLAALVVVALALPDAPRVGVVAQDPASLGDSGPDAAGTGLPEEVADPAQRRAALARLLIDRGEAIRTDDARTYRSQHAPGARVPAFARLAVLPVTTWTYEIDGLTAGQDPRSADLALTVRYRLDVDVVDAVVGQTMTVRHDGTRWRIVREATDGPRAQPWDLGDLVVVRGSSSLVIGVDVDRSTARTYARAADRVTPDVTDVWGPGWSRAPVLVVPRTTAMAARGLDRDPGSMGSIAAVTTAEDGLGERSGGRGADRIWTNTPTMASLSGLGREIVLRHEITHVAVGAAATGRTPLWLEEGFAEYVGYRGSGVPLRVATRTVLAAERAGTGPTSLPEGEEFAGPGIAVAYESAHLACSLVVRQVGEDGLVRLYRLTADGPGEPDANVDAALREVIGVGLAGFEKQWRAYLAEVAG
jgi:hypothetical protein